jgi:hypothetical protein
MEQEPVYETDQVEAVDGPVKSTPLDEMVAFVESQFRRSEDNRMPDETRWLLAFRNFRGKYGPDVMFSEAEKSRVFIKVTKTKVLAAYGQITEVLFGNGDFPLSVDNTKLPEGVVEDVSFDPQAPPSPGAPPSAPSPVNIGTRDQGPLPPGTTIFDLQKVGPLQDKLKPVEDKLHAGPGLTATAVTFHPAHVAAKKMEKKIKDQLDESGASKHLRMSAFEACLFGTGVLKGPFAVDKEYPNWDATTGQYTPIIKTRPFVESVSIWNFYPDPDAANMDEVEWVVQRHKMSRTNMYDLKKRPYFRKDAVEKALECGPNYLRKYWETTINDDNVSDTSERWEVLEYWGYCETDMLKEKGLTIPRELQKVEQLNVNIWVCNGQVLRLVMNPFKPTRIPYYAVPYELNPYSFFGIGVAENMEDTQLLMNGFMRMAVDNAALSGNLIIEVDEETFSEGQDLNIRPGMIVKRKAGAPGQSIFGTEFPNVSNQNMMMFDKARVLADESTGLPSYSHGQTGIQGVGRTASGISMLMNAANGAIRTVIKNIDDYLIGPLGRSMFAFNMQFDFDPEFTGDLEINARGVESLMAGEVKSQRLMQFLGTVANPILAPFVKLDVLVREIAESLDLDPDSITNSLPDAAIQAEVLKGFQAATQGAAPPEGQQAPTAGADAQDTVGSGGGQVGTGSVPAPGTQGFSANGG